MRFKAGYLTVGSWDGAPIRVHWTTPVAAFVLGAGHWTAAFWLGFCLVLLVHAIGHARMVYRVGGMVDSIDVTGWGGHCLWSGHPMLFEDALVAAGGVLAQAIALLATAVLLVVLGWPQNAFVVALVQAFVGLNVVVVLINAIPVEPLDGARAWRLLPFVIEWLEVQRLRAGYFTQPRRRTGAAKRRSDYAKVINLDERLDRELDRILSSAGQQKGDDERPPDH